MSTSTPTSVRTGPGARLGPARVETVIIRRLLGEMGKLTRWFWPAAGLIAVGVAVVISAVSTVTSSIWENVAQWPCWWLFAMATALVYSQLPMLVLQGVTRRAALRALAVSAGLISLIWAVFMVCGQVVERFAYGRLGWPDTMTSPHLFAGGYDVVPMLAEYWLLFLAYLAAGSLIGGLYYRFGAVGGTLLLPLGLLPVAAMEGLLATGWYGAGLQEGLSISRPAPLVLAVGAVVIMLLAGLATCLVLRDVPIRPKT
jgi:hypothetical protein